MRYLVWVMAFFMSITTIAQTATEQLKQCIEASQSFKWNEGSKQLHPLGVFSKERFEKESAFAKAQLKKLNTISPKTLSETERISLELLKFKLQETVDYYEYERFLNPLLSDSGFHSSWNYMVRPITSYKQAVKYLDKLNALPEVVNQYVPLLREGIKKGVSQPRVIFEGYESTYNSQIVADYKDSFYYTPFLNLPESITEEQKDSLETAAKLAIENSVVPAFKSVKAFFENEYFPNTRTTIGVSETPNGDAYYQNRIHYYTTLDITADAVHNKGLEEVARIKSEMEKIIKEVAFKGSFADFLKFLREDEQFYAKSPEQLLMIARDMAKRADAQLPRFFKTLPRKPYGVAPVPDAIAPKYTGGRYVGSPKGSTSPGYYWVNTYDLPSRTLYTLPSLTVHEAVPGHHLQGALNQELGDSIPQFRRNMYVNAYGEGWGLYCEYLAAEMGMYTTPYERFGQLTYEMWRACRLVVDTGIHAKAWTREEVVAFMSQNTALSLHEIQTETDRYISWPGQALAYKMGELKIRELRTLAEKELGSRFDIRDFHEVILEQGTVTLAILDRRVKDWIQKSN
ncbi:DUF885 domain-containing protein [Dokdonia donghaensis]|uniref:DUF885 domain-containing protein n=1 Tax=Dokdonia donghaensis DSW-1 TaxID=1300343 RepID=A0A0A2GTW5_9FLAO|nr:DUF885 domain-containing protein [Dokdonia donghaensis]ANH59292.1 hypothetical protein I597_0360 [Dokdonia donghaensis DSW-1]KGO06697.1 hypothetical protein NV36_07465 [Dokdonia donghaensis DSW-1]